MITGPSPDQLDAAARYAAVFGITADTAAAGIDPEAGTIEIPLAHLRHLLAQTGAGPEAQR